MIAPSQSDANLGVLAGTVLCGDTGRPARFASVRISGASTLDGTTSQVATSDYDGHFAIPQLKPGDYYVDVVYSGYVDVLKNVSSSEDVSASAQKWAQSGEGSVVRATVSSGRTTTVTAVLARGASASGIVVYDDGTPAPLVTLDAVRLPGPGTDGSDHDSLALGAGNITSAQTDDRGMFRLSGLPPGKYTLRVNLPEANLRSWFLGDTVEMPQAHSFDIVSGDDYQGLSIHLPATAALLTSH